MTEGQSLFLVIILLYIVDCFVWVGKKTVLLSSKWLSKWQLSFAHELLGSTEGSPVFLNPLPPIGIYFQQYWLPISISPVGVSTFTLQNFPDMTGSFGSGATLKYEEITESDNDGKYLILNGSRFVKCEAEDQAKLLAKLIEIVSTQPLKNREKLIREFLAGRFAEKEALSRLNQVKYLSAGLLWTCSVFFIFLYVLSPILATIYGLNRIIIPVAIVMVISSIYIALTYFRAHKCLHPSKSHERVSNVAKMIFCPPTAIRATDLLTLNTMSKFHPLLIANLLIDSDNLKLNRSVISDLKFPIRMQATNQLSLIIASWYAKNELGLCMNFLEEQNPKALIDIIEPPSCDGDSYAYCPRCSSQFTIHFGECPDCPGVELRKFTAIPKNRGK